MAHRAERLRGAGLRRLSGRLRIGQRITGIGAAEATGATVFHAGTRLGPGGLETAGGRVLGVTAGADDLQTAIDRAYDAAGKIHFEGMHYRTDIGRKGFDGTMRKKRGRSSDG